MKITILQHSNGTPPGTVLDWIKERGHQADVRRLQDTPAGQSLLPSLSETEFLIILGGPMNVDDVDKHPWLNDEKKFLRQAIEGNKPCVGLCLGGQLLAQTLGATVRKHKHWEVGWHSVQLNGGKKDLTVFQWHQDTFGLPEGAMRIATNSITENQGFRFRDHVVGLQFHPEATPEWVKECTEEEDYPQGPYVQDEATVMAGLDHLPQLRRWFFELLDEVEKNAQR